MKTIEMKNQTTNFALELVENRKRSLRLERKQSSEQLEKTLKKLSATDLYCASDEEPFEGASPPKVSTSDWRAENFDTKASWGFMQKLRNFHKAFFKITFLLSIHLMLSPQVIQSITVDYEQQAQWRAKIRLVASVRKVSKTAYVFSSEQAKNNQTASLLTASERNGGIGLGLNTQDWLVAYQETLEFIRQHEGWNNGCAYYDAGGVKTIGYGHVITKHDNLPDKITRQQADSILQVDFNKALRACDRVTSLRGYKRLAIAHFIFAKGIGSFNRSKVKQKILAGEDIESELLEWSTYRSTNGKTYHSEYSENIRKWELEMYRREK